MNVLKYYIDYFKYIATTHPELQHDDASGDRVFEVMDVEEAFGDFRSAAKEKGVMMRLLLPFGSLTDEQSGNSRIIMQGGFLLAAYHSSRDQGTPEFLNAMSKSYRIAHEIAEKMVDDAQQGHPLFNFSIRSVQHLNWSVQSRVMTADGNYSGYFCLFNFEAPFRNCLAEHENEAWKNPTPHNFD